MSVKKNAFKSSLDLSKLEVFEILQNKIAEENILLQANTTSDNLEFEEFLLNQVNYDLKKINVLSLFSGAGGLDLGIKLASISVSLGEETAYKSIHQKETFEKYSDKINFMYSNDIFSSANETYTNNFGTNVVKDNRDIRKIINFPKSDLILGGFPCPGFSSAGPRLLDDPRNFLYIHYIRALIQSQPYFFIAENVKGLMTMANGEVLSQMTEDFSAAGYKVTAHLVNSRDYGVPQLRERVFIIGVRNDISASYKYNLPLPSHDGKNKSYITLKDAIYDLPLYPDDVFDSGYSSMYMSRNRKKSWNEQSFTIQASGRQAPQHPAGMPMVKIDKDKWEFKGDFNRRLSVRETARIQTFPDWFIFSNGNKINTSKNNQLNEQYKQIGNAVPVYLSEKISRPIIEFLNLIKPNT